MKNTLVTASLIPVLAFTLAIAAQFAGLVSFRFLDLAWLIGGFAATGVLAFALRDYTRKPAFRVHHSRQFTPQAKPSAGRAAAAADTTWTYNTRFI